MSKHRSVGYFFYAICKKFIDKLKSVGRDVEGNPAVTVVAGRPEGGQPIKTLVRKGKDNQPITAVDK